MDAGYLKKVLSVAANGARIAIFDLLGGVSIDCNLVDFLSKNVGVFGRTLGTQRDQVKRRLLAELETIVWPAVERGNVHHCIEQIVMPDENIEASQNMRHGDQLGKTIVLIK